MQCPRDATREIRALMGEIVEKGLVEVVLSGRALPLSSDFLEPEECIVAYGPPVFLQTPRVPLLIKNMSLKKKKYTP
jgi:hypothetical protein